MRLRARKARSAGLSSTHPTRLHEQFELALQNGFQIGIHDAPHLGYIKSRLLAPDPSTEFVPHVERVLDVNYWTKAKQKH